MVAPSASKLLAPLAAVSLLSTSCFAATLYGEKSQTIRREAPVQNIQMTAQGEMIQVATKPNTLVKVDEDLEALASQFCDYDFPVGTKDSNNCTESSKHALILQENMCIFAASEAGAVTSHDHFQEPWDWEDEHPKGCFEYPCTEAPHGTCYFYNGDGDWPHKPKGVPICSRPKHLNGTKDSAAEDGGCPTGYQVIDHGDVCFQSATCLGYCTGSEFRIGQHNASKHLDYPRGCFIDNTDGCVYYNGASDMGRGTKVEGTPICNVSSTTTWPAKSSSA